MPIIRINFLDVMLTCRNDVKQIGGAKKYCLREFGNGFARRFDQRGADWQPSPQSGRAIIVKLRAQFLKCGLSKSTLAPLSVKNTGYFKPPEGVATHSAQAFGQRSNGVTFRFIEIKFCDVCRIEITHGILLAD